MSLTGTWQLSIATPVGDRKFELDLVQHGPDQISGQSRFEQEEAQDLTNPQLQGNTLTWTSRIQRPIKATAKMELTFDGDSVIGMARAGVFPAKITGRRAL